jgi:hypothetical protein
MNPRTCVDPSGRFNYGIHKPHYQVNNFREKDYIMPLGRRADGTTADNNGNFPEAMVDVAEADWIFEIPNAFPFKGTTYISQNWAAAKAQDPLSIALPQASAVSLGQTLATHCNTDPDTLDRIYQALPEPMQLALATTSTDPDELIRLAGLSCQFIFDSGSSAPSGLKYQPNSKRTSRPCIHNLELFEAVANNPYLPEVYKQVMVLRPGVQGKSEIVGEWIGGGGDSHVFEYLRTNSYIPWGHYAANMAHDAARYRVQDLTLDDMRGMRHLYYQRTYTRLLELLALRLPDQRKRLAVNDLESIRLQIMGALSTENGLNKLTFNNTLWGWNFGFDFAPTGYRLHASHQQIHQQFAMIPAGVKVAQPNSDSSQIPSYACGDLVQDFIQEYYRQTGRRFFEAYLQAIRSNQRMDGLKNYPNSLIVYEDEQVLLFVPKAQTSQWELQLMTRQAVGNVLETDTSTRASLDRAMLTAVHVLEAMGAKMITTIEYAKRFDIKDSDQRLLYVFLPRIPWSPGAFSEAQLRWINGHYPEDFAAACRSRLQNPD